MSEGIDVALMGAKVAASKNQAASIAVHTLSVSYNIAQMARYRALYAGTLNAQLSGDCQNFVVIRNQYRKEYIKHAVLTGIDVFSLFMIGLSGWNKQ